MRRRRREAGGHLDGHHGAQRRREELRASEARFRTFVDHATDAFFLHDDDLLIVDVNRQACEALATAVKN